MRTTPYDVHRRDVLAVECPHCSAAPGAFCMRPNGEVAPWQHSSRIAAALHAERETVL